MNESTKGNNHWVRVNKNKITTEYAFNQDYLGKKVKVNQIMTKRLSLHIFKLTDASLSFNPETSTMYVFQPKFTFSNF